MDQEKKMKPLTKRQQKKLMKVLSLTTNLKAREILCKIEHGDLPYNEIYLVRLTIKNPVFSLKSLNNLFMEWALKRKDMKGRTDETTD